MHKLVQWISDHFVTVVVLVTLITVTAIISNNQHDHSKCNHDHGAHHTDTGNP